MLTDWLNQPRTNPVAAAAGVSTPRIDPMASLPINGAMPPVAEGYLDPRISRMGGGLEAMGGIGANAQVDQPAAGGWWGDFLKGAVGTRETPGWGGLALGAAQGVTGAFLGMQQLNIAKETLAQNKREFELNFGAQRQTLNTAIEDRAANRVARNANSESVESYMDRNRIR